LNPARMVVRASEGTNRTPSGSHLGPKSDSLTKDRRLRASSLRPILPVTHRTEDIPFVNKKIPVLDTT
jgi:hypothetical protein